MKPRITFRTGRKIRKDSPRGGQRGRQSYTDVDLDPELRDSLASWRGKLDRFLDRSHSPLSMDIRHTLAVLGEIPDSEADEVVRGLDRETYSLLKHAAYQNFRDRFPERRPVPNHAVQIRQHYHGRVVLAITPGHLRELASLALSAYPKTKGGAPKITGFDQLFGAALVHHWVRIHGTPATIKRIGGTPFMEWAEDMFERVGRRSQRGKKNKKPPLGDLYLALRFAIREYKKR